MKKKPTRRGGTTTWPYVRWIKSRQRWQVDARTKDGGERRFFPTKPEAEGWRQTQLIRRQNEGGSAFDDSRLAKYGWSIAQAIRFALDHLEKQATSVSIPDAIAALVEVKKAAKRSDRYCDDLKSRLGRLAAAFPEKSIGAIITGDLDKFLAELKLAPGTTNTFRRDIRTLWSYAEKRGWTIAKVAKNTETATTDTGVPGIATVAQASTMLDKSSGELRTFLAIGFFAGLRVAEVKRLDWHDVELTAKNRFINVTGASSKTRSRRLVPILPNLHAWLSLVPVEERKGKVVKKDFRHAWDLVRVQAGFGPFFSTNKAVNEAQHDKQGKPLPLIPWPDNAMRHSFVSYRLADTNDAAKVALEAGHDQDMLFKHYREIVRPAAAKKYFQIRPAARAGKVTSIATA